MRLEKITVQNFLGVPDFQHQLRSPMLFIGGPNGAGKTSLQDALRFALTGELVRGMRKVSDRPQLITDGAAAGYVELVIGGYSLRRNIGSGKLIEGGDTPDLPAALALTLDPPRFAALPDAELRKCLFSVVGVQVNRDVVAQQLTARDVAPDVIERVLPMLRDGFPAAAAYAKEQAAQARGAWSSITGENYGSQKAVGWSAAKPATPPDENEITETRGLLEKAEQRVHELTEAKGRAAGAVSEDRRAELQREADAGPARDDAVATAAAKRDAAAEKVKTLENEAAGHSGMGFDCPKCHAKLILDGQRVRLAPEGAVAPTKAHAALTKAKQVLATAARDLTAAQDAALAAKTAARTLETLPKPSSDDLAAAAMLDEERQHLTFYRDLLRTLEDRQRMHDSADTTTRRAAAEHERVQAWMKAQDALSPDGIMATLLSLALDPVNDALAAQAAQAGFRPARVERDLSLTYAGRPYALCSESEQWRADALFAVVIAVLSGTGVVALDRFDVLDLASREAAIDWLASLTEGEAPYLDTVIVSGTLKAKPDLGEGIDVVWLNGKGAPLQAVA